MVAPGEEQFHADVGSRYGAVVSAILAPLVSVIIGVEAFAYLGIGFALTGLMLWLSWRQWSVRTVCDPEGLHISTAFRTLDCAWADIESCGVEGYSLLTFKDGQRFRVGQFEYRGVGTRWLALHSEAFSDYRRYVPVLEGYRRTYSEGQRPLGPRIRSRWPSLKFAAALVALGAVGEIVALAV